MNIEDDLFPGCTIASSVQYPPSNYELMLQVKSWSGKRIDLDINNHSFYSLFVFITVQYLINSNNKNLLSQILAGA
ncbi:200_t:CDS:2 [Funneliformis caledonium]|uniref:200_t:CDS:1 n=1 Tax=Funneliformis caledonium TaxID=1117310 RepID=A0A9N9CQC4_9GLOM|nr:200_t:CDS:2 [Funneliformis caledonium]